MGHGLESLIGSLLKAQKELSGRMDAKKVSPPEDGLSVTKKVEELVKAANEIFSEKKAQGKPETAKE